MPDYHILRITEVYGHAFIARGVKGEVVTRRGCFVGIYEMLDGTLVLGKNFKAKLVEGTDIYQRQSSAKRSSLKSTALMASTSPPIGIGPITSTTLRITSLTRNSAPNQEGSKK